MERILLKAEKRTELGKGGARALRRHGLLPAVLYDKGDSTPIKLPRKEIAALMVLGRGEHTLFNIELSSDKSKKKAHWVIVKDYQVDPVRNELLHIDFMEISLEKEIKMTVSAPVVEEVAPVEEEIKEAELVRKAKPKEEEEAAEEE